MAQQFAPTVRIVNQIDETQLVTLKGNTPPAANAKNDRGRVSSTLPMTDLILVLSRSPEQQAAFDKFVASQYEAGSPDFHHWLAPAEVGTNFGPSETDIATVSNWLTGHGFTIGEVTKDRMTIRFSGTAGQVESTFHTEIHNLEVGGVPHLANMSDPQIPAALGVAVVGVKGMHNFFPKPLHTTGGLVTRDSSTGKWQRVASTTPAGSGAPQAAKAGGIHPQFTVNDPTDGLIEDVVPYDFATIYNVLPLWNATSPIDGTGQKIAIAGTSDINLSDVATFRSSFGLPSATPVPQQLAGVNGLDPGICTSTSSTAVCGIGDLEENTLDVEWSGSVAKGAQIILVTSGSKSATDDTVYDSSSYVISGKSTPIAPILNVSYGECELYEGAASNTAYNTLWQTAATEGVAVFVAAGDEGSAVCDNGNENNTPLTLAPAVEGLAVSGLASSPYDTAVGGTDFNWCNPTVNSSGNVVGCSTSAPYWSTTNNATTLESAVGYIPEVPWNDTCTTPAGVAYLASIASFVGVSGVNTPESACNFVSNYYITLYNEYQIDLSFFVNVAGGSGGASTCANNTTTISANGTETVGTCTSGWPKPSYQTALTPADNVRDLPDVSFFAANGVWSSSYLICVSEVGACTYSATAETTYLEVGGTSVSSPAMAGVMALINQKTGASQGNPNTELYKLAGQQTYSSCSSEGPPGSSCYFHDVDKGTISMPCAAGTLNCTVATSGDSLGVLSGYSATTGYDDATGLGSLNVANVVNAFPTLAGSGTATVTVTPTPTSITANQTLSVAVTVASKPTGGTTPTGTVTLSGGGYTSSAEALSGGTYTFSIPPDSLSAGTDTLTVSYSGDANYGTATGTATVAVSKLPATVTATASPATINSNQTVTVSGTVSGGTGNPTPTGTVTLTGGGYTSAATALTSGSYSILIPVNSLAAGADTLNVAYSGDATYATENGSTTVTVTTISVLTPTVTVTPASTTVDSNASLSVTAKVAGAGVTPTGTVTLTSGSYTSAAGTLASGSFTFTIPAGSLANGSDTLTVSYSGDGNYASGSGTATVTVDVSAFTLAASAAPAIATPGGSSSSTITVTAANGYSGTVTLGCTLTNYTSGDIDLPTCTIPSAAVAAGGTATATVTTTSASAELAYPKMDGRGRGWAGAGGGAVLALLLFLGIPARRRSWRTMVGMLVLMVMLGSLAGCGGGSSTTTPTGTTPDTYTFTVTGTGSPAVTPAPTITFSVTVN
jgi:hypothetical protein